jgi:predicted ribosomally synthesized peptide with SipW-like signal peptide
MVKKILFTLIAVGLLSAMSGMGGLAVFTDQAANDANTFTTGTVDISTSPASAFITFSNMAPGDSTTQSLVVSNAGTLQLRYAISSSATNTDGKGLKDQLVLTIKTIDVTTPATPCDNFDGTQLYTGDLDGTTGALVGSNTQGQQAGDRTLNASSNETLCFRVALPLSTGNAYQNATTTATFTFDAEQTINNP